MTVMSDKAVIRAADQMARDARADVSPQLDRTFTGRGEEVFNMLSNAHQRSGNDAPPTPRRVVNR